MRKAFEIGRTVITSHAMRRLQEEVVIKALRRHMQCDWGESSDKEANDIAVENGNDRVISVYRDGKGTRFWIITEADRSATTILLPEDY